MPVVLITYLILLQTREPQVLVLSPTRELAVQIQKVRFYFLFLEYLQIMN